MDSLIKSIDELKDSLTKKSEETDVEDLKLAVKARDDEIEAWKKKVEVLTKSKEEKKESKTVKEDEKEEEIEIEPDDPFVMERGEAYLRY